MNAQEQQAFDAMLEALEVLNNLDADINFLNTNELEEMVDKALSAAKAVSEPKVQPTITNSESRDPQASEPAWMPIETAPKDGEFLLAVWEGDWNNPKQRLAVYQARGWAKGGPTWAMKGNYRTEEGGAYSLAGWMPLPAAPEATK